MSQLATLPPLLAAEMTARSRLFEEDMLRLADVARLLPRRSDGRQVSRVTLWRWATKGVRVPGMPPGQRARLATMKLGLTTYTSRQALERFAAVLEGRPLAEQGREIIRTARRRRRDVEQAKARMRELGLM
jgi:hypothetical protein